MRKITAILGVAAVAAAGFIGYAWHVDGRGAVDEGALDGPLSVAGTPVERGRYLATAADCVACHTVPGVAEYAGGVAFRLPFGTIYSSNLTPDPDAGIGSWSDEDFLRAVRSGVGRGGRHLYPAHPYPTYAAMARNDVLAIRAYLASLPPVPAKVPDGDLRFPYSQRGLMPLWNAVFLDGKRFKPDASRDEAWNRGAYLATALGHCGECHTPRNAAYALQSGRALTGAVTRGWKAYDITARATGIGGWTEAALDEYLATGHADGHGSAAGPMKEAVVYGTSQLTAADRKALVGYLLAGAPGAGDASRTPAVATAPATSAATGGIGATLYAGTCAGCHSLEQQAAPGSYADLSGARTVRDPEGTNILKLLSEGSPHGVGEGTSMPGFGRGYSDTERAALANYVLVHWGRLPPSLTPKDAMRARSAE
jgi:mono/diheme cytochrome c family protein